MKILTIQNDSYSTLQTFINAEGSQIVFRISQFDGKLDYAFEDFPIYDLDDIQSIIDELIKLKDNLINLNR